MKWLGGAATAVLLALVAPAHAGGFGLPNGPCLLFCDAKPAAAARATDAKPIAAPRDLHPTHAAADSAVEPKRASRPTPASKPSHFIHRPQPVIASAPRPIPTPPRPLPVAVASTPVAVPSMLAARSVANASELKPASASAAPSEEANSPAVAPNPNPVEHGSDPAIHLLAQAFSESPQQAPTSVASPAPPTPKTVPVASPPPVTVAMVEPAEPSSIVRVTANGLVFPWWPDSFPSRAALWIVAVGLIAAAAFGLVIASGKRLAA
jgi:hypothetical protein